jgi:hypothetical protein
LGLESYKSTIIWAGSKCKRRMIVGKEEIDYDKTGGQQLLMERRNL